MNENITVTKSIVTEHSINTQLPFAWVYDASSVKVINNDIDKYDIVYHTIKKVGHNIKIRLH